MEDCHDSAGIKQTKVQESGLSYINSLCSVTYARAKRPTPKLRGENVVLSRAEAVDCLRAMSGSELSGCSLRLFPALKLKCRSRVMYAHTIQSQVSKKCIPEKERTKTFLHQLGVSFFLSNSQLQHTAEEMKLCATAMHVH